MTRILASILALTIAAPALADSATTQNNSATSDSAVTMNKDWKSEDLATFDAPMIERDGWKVADTQTMTAEQMTGMNVYGENDEWIGEIDNVMISTDGKIEGVVLGVGGFVGIGEKDVLVSFDSLTIRQEIDGDDLRAYVSMTEEQLEELPAYES